MNLLRLERNVSQLDLSGLYIYVDMGDPGANQRQQRVDNEGPRMSKAQL